MSQRALRHSRTRSRHTREESLERRFARIDLSYDHGNSCVDGFSRLVSKAISARRADRRLRSAAAREHCSGCATEQRVAAEIWNAHLLSALAACRDDSGQQRRRIRSSGRAKEAFADFPPRWRDRARRKLDDYAGPIVSHIEIAFSVDCNRERIVNVLRDRLIRLTLAGAILLYVVLGEIGYVERASGVYSNAYRRNDAVGDGPAGRFAAGRIDDDVSGAESVVPPQTSVTWLATYMVPEWSIAMPSG